MFRAWTGQIQWIEEISGVRAEISQRSQHRNFRVWYKVSLMSPQIITDNKCVFIKLIIDKERREIGANCYKAQGGYMNLAAGSWRLIFLFGKILQSDIAPAHQNTARQTQAKKANNH